jgi:hypothetical protein
MRKPQDWTKPARTVGAWEPWEGGRARWDGARWTFYLWRQGGPRPVRCSTGQHTHAGALAHLAAYEGNPDTYRPEAVRVGGEPLLFSEELVVEHLDYLAAPQEKGGRGDSPAHLRNVKRSLAWWRERLGECDLRGVSAEELRRHLPHNLPGRTHRLAAVKHFVRWLRESRTGGASLGRDEGPDVDVLKLPQAKGHKLHDPRRALARKMKGTHAELGWKACRESRVFQGSARLAYRDMLDLLYFTGWHLAELVRWLRLGSVVEEPSKAARTLGVAGVLWTVHKSGKEYRTGVDREHREIAERLATWHKRARLLRKGRKFARVAPIPERFLSELVERSVEERRAYGRKHGIDELAELAAWAPGALRHAYATRALAAGLPGNAVAQSMGHAAGSELLYSTYADPHVQVRVAKLKSA